MKLKLKEEPREWSKFTSVIMFLVLVLSWVIWDRGWIASGVFYSVERFPEVVQPILRLLPLTPLIDAMRSVMQEGQELTTLGSELSICAAWGIVTFVLALRWFRWN